ncbi:zinc-ribbon domain-containing protein [Acidianus brierleyi]|uniref:Zinc-ribbon domain-containing protein n=1 Tax=Acidianus brierleyi TaxID=41673 RepID=A0A2U9IHM8_9CREN|nr:zinc-ribbon domain-containing protein [Acidianus brierleyi]AWR95485.1 hypothetical protein DFR85_13660 [Acidianus brierleyi]
MQTCPMCGANLVEGLSYCQVCGADVSIYDQIYQSIQGVSPFQSPGNQQNFQQQDFSQQGFQQQNFPQQDFQQNFQQQNPQYQQGIPCPNCGFMNPPDAKVCGNCGQELKKHHHHFF